MLEHGAYNLLLDRYYITEKGIPQDQAHRVCRARSKDERAAVDAVLSEFFVLEDGHWVKDRVEREIEKVQAKIKAAQENGKRGGRPKRTEKEPSGFPAGSESETQSKAHQPPITSHQTPEVDNPSGLSPVQRASPAEICRDLKTAGIADVNPGHPRLLALCEAGAQAAEFLGFVPTAIDKAPGRGFAYVLGAVEGERKRAAQTAGSLHRGPMPGKQDCGETAYQRSMRERMAEAAPGLQRTAPGQPKPVVIDAESRQLESLQ